MTFVFAGLAAALVGVSGYLVTQNGKPASMMDCSLTDPTTGMTRVVYGSNCGSYTVPLYTAGFILGFGVLPGAAAAVWPYSAGSTSLPPAMKPMPEPGR
jgi:hypothetical protein